jgi:hypothetical protein
MERTYSADKLDISNIISIQKEILEENKRLRFLTAWLTALTVVLVVITMASEVLMTIT